MVLSLTLKERIHARLEERRTWVWATSLLLGLSLLLWRPLWQGPVVEFIDVGQGDATFIRTATGETLLVDGGDSTQYMDYGKAVVVPFLLGQGVTHLDYVIVTHFDRDHIGGLFTVTEQLAVGEVLLPWYPSGKPLEDEFIEHCEARDIAFRRIARGESLPLDGDPMTVLHPPSTGWEMRSDNEQSLVFMLHWNGLDILLPGDAEHNAEAEVVAQGACEADILKAGHHGSHTSSSNRFLEAVQPRYVIASTRSSPTRTGVHPEVRRRIALRHIPLWRTDYHGGLRLQPIGDGFELQGARHVRGYSLAPE